MRHNKAGVKLNRTTSHRQAMFKNMVTSLFKHDRIRTTDVKAKELRRWADHVITLAKRGDLHARRQVLAIVQEKDVVHKIFEEVGKRFGSINGGYTRIIKIGRRPGDAAPVSIIELVTAGDKAEPKKKAKGPAKKKVSEPQTKPAEKAIPAKAEDSEGAAAPEAASEPEKEQAPEEQAAAAAPQVEPEQAETSAAEADDTAPEVAVESPETKPGQASGEEPETK
jgi:large subunit ribosomal protein L17